MKMKMKINNDLAIFGCVITEMDLFGEPVDNNTDSIVTI